MNGFDDWGNLGVDGLKAVAISAVYSVIPVAILGLASIFGIGIAVAGLGDSAAGGLVGGTLTLLLVVLCFVLSIAGAYVTPAALSNFAETDRLTASFDFRLIWTVITTKAYAIGWLTVMAVILGGAVVVSVLSVPFHRDARWTVCPVLRPGSGLLHLWPHLDGCPTDCHRTS